MLLVVKFINGISFLFEIKVIFLSCVLRYINEKQLNRCAGYFFLPIWGVGD
jgi:hypothetical protein